MLGAGVFTVFGPAAQSAGTLLPLALLVAALVATANALSTAQLAQEHPVAGGAYAYGRRYLGPWPGYVAGLMFVVGKLASCCAIALTVGAYAWPGQERVVAIAAVLVMAAINAAGVTRTARTAAVTVGVVVAVLVLAIVIGVVDPPSPARVVVTASHTPGLLGVTQAAGLLFFAFAGYARIATLGEEVKAPRRTIPRAIILTLVGALALYTALAVVLLWRVGVNGLAASPTPVRALVGQVGWAGSVVAIGAVVAGLGSLLALLAGVSRTALAMSREGDLPRGLARLNGRGVPAVADAIAAVIVVALIGVLDLRIAISLSGVSVLVYYLVANLAALAQPPHERRYPRLIPIGGVIGCATLALSLPHEAVLSAAVVLGCGVLVRVVARGLRR